MRLEREDVCKDGVFTRACWVVVRFRDGRHVTYASQEGSEAPACATFFEDVDSALKERDELRSVAELVDS